MKIRKILLIPILALLLGGCKPSTSIQVPPDVTSGEIVNPESITINAADNKNEIKVNETLKLNATVLPEGANQEVIWSSSDAQKAEVDNQGLVTAKGEGNVFIIATSKVESAVSKQFALKIIAADPVVVTPESIVIASVGNVTQVEIGKTLQLGATVLPSGASQEVAWSSSDNTKATVSASGLVTGVALGSITINAQSVSVPTVKAAFNLEVVDVLVPEPTHDWENMEFSNHSDYVAVSTPKDTPFKVKGKVTHVTDVKEDKVSYFIQNDLDGYYIYNQDAALYPVVLGNMYTVGGFFVNYNGTREITNIEYFVDVTGEVINTPVTNVSLKDVTNLDEMAPHHASFVSLDVAVLSLLPTNYTKAYTVKVMVNEKEFDLRVDPNIAGATEFAAITSLFQSTPIGSALSLIGIMSAFGYGTPKNQLQIVKAEHITVAALDPQTEVEVAISSLEIIETAPLGVTNISLPTELAGYEGLTIVWTSGDAAIISNSGAVTHPLLTTDVTLSVTITKETGSATRNFIISVFGSDETKLTALHTLNLEDAGPVGNYGLSTMKPKYNVPETNNMVDSGTPLAKWQLNNALIGGDNNDKRLGEFAIRIQSNAVQASSGRIELQDNTHDFNILEFKTAIYGANRKGMEIMFEVSTDDGATWTGLERTITINHFELDTYRVRLGTSGNVRVAIIMKAGTGQRVNIDEIRLLKEVV